MLPEFLSGYPRLLGDCLIGACVCSFCDAGAMGLVRYTANQPFPQCAVYSSTTLGPAMPFIVKLGADGFGPN